MKPGILLSSPKQPLQTQTLIYPDLQYLMHFDYFKLWVFMLFRENSFQTCILHFSCPNQYLFSLLPALCLDSSRVKKYRFDFLTFAICSYELWSLFCFPASAFYTGFICATAEKLYHSVGVDWAFPYFCFFALKKSFLLAQLVVFAALFHSGRKGTPLLVSLLIQVSWI